MHNPSRRTVLQSAASLASFAALGARPAFAQSAMGPILGPTHTPAHPWTVVVPFPPGGRTSFIAQRLVVALAEVLGETVVLEHKTGDAIREMEAFTQLPAGGRTLMLAMVRLPRRGVFKPDADNAMLSLMEPVALVAREPMVLCISAHSARRLDINSLEQLLRYARKHPGKLTIASDSDGATTMLAAELFKSMSQTYMTRMASVDRSTDMQSVIAGETDVMFESVHITRRAIQADALRPLAYTASPTQPELNWAALQIKKPVPLLYNLPEFRQYEIYDYQTLFAPPSMDAEQLALISVTTAKALGLPDFKDRLLASYALPDNLNREQFLALENQEEARWRKARGRW